MVLINADWWPSLTVLGGNSVLHTVKLWSLLAPKLPNGSGQNHNTESKTSEFWTTMLPPYSLWPYYTSKPWLVYLLLLIRSSFCFLFLLLCFLSSLWGYRPVHSAGSWVWPRTGPSSFLIPSLSHEAILPGSCRRPSPLPPWTPRPGAHHSALWWSFSHHDLIINIDYSWCVRMCKLDWMWNFSISTHRII